MIGRKSKVPDIPLNGSKAQVQSGKIRWHMMIVRTIFPVALTIALFLFAFWEIALPTIRHIMMQNKRELIRDLTHTAWGILDNFENQARQGKLARKEAQESAKEEIRRLRYGIENKDYFWICDMNFKSVMNPYRPDHEGHDQSQLQDPNGVHLIVEFVRTARERGEGYVDYMWQWQDNPHKIVAKISYVKLFKPWGWIIGTGIYSEDVDRQIVGLTRTMKRIFNIIIVFLLIFSVNIIAFGLILERQRQKATASVSESEKKFRTIFNSICQFIALLTPDGKLLDVNQTALEFIGLERAELIGQSFDETPWWQGYPDSQAELRQAFALGRAGQASHFECQIKGKERENKIMDVCLTPLKNAAGEVSQLIAEGHDITERKLAEEEICQREENLDVTLNSINDAVIVTDTDLRVVHMNPAAERMSGWSLSDIAGQPMAKFIHLADSQTRLKKEIHRPDFGAEVSTPLLFLTKSGAERIVSSSEAPIHDRQGNNTGYIFVFRDISGEIHLQDQLRHAQKMEAIGQLAGGIAHDFNNFLTGIIGNAELLKMKQPDDPKYRDHIKNIIEISLRAADLNSQLLAFSRRGKVHHAAVDIHDTINNVINILQETIDRRITIKKYFNAEVPAVIGDPTQLQNALLNMAINARDAMPEGGNLTFTTGNELLDDNYCRQSPYRIQPGKYVNIRVIDTGVGISAENQKRIFEPFFTTKEVGKGTGLGLSAVDGIIKDHHGTIRLHSETGAGSVFTILLPSSDAKPTAATMADSQQNEPLHGQGRILVVEDEETIRLMAAHLLTSIGYDVVTAANGDEAIALFHDQHEQIDLVLLDLIMPQKDGQETFQALRAIKPSVKVLISSGYQKNIQVESILQQGAVGFLQKPYQISEISKKVAEALKSSANEKKGQSGEIDLQAPPAADSKND